MQKSCTLIWGYVHCKTSPDHLKHEAKERQKGLIQPLTCQQHLLQPLAAEMIRAQSCLCVQAPWASDRFKESFCGNIPWSHSPRLAGWSEQPEGRSSWETFLSKWQRNLPQSFPACSPVEVAEQVHPKDSLRVTGAPCRPAGGGFAWWEQQGEEKPQASASLCQKASNTIYRLFPGVGNSFPLPSLTGYVTQPHTCKGMMWPP